MPTKKKSCGGCGKLIPYNETCGCRKRKVKKSSELSETDKLRKTARWARKRNYIKERDGGHCQRCLIKYSIINSKDLSAHHIEPADIHELFFDENNLVCVCMTCNRQLGQKGIDFDWEPPKLEYNL